VTCKLAYVHTIHFISHFYHQNKASPTSYVNRTGDHASPEDSNYGQDLRKLLTMLKTRVKHVALVGPTLRTRSGETPDHWKTDNVTVAFIRENEKACDEVGVHYINTRKAFQAIILKEIQKGAIVKKITEFSWKELKDHGIKKSKDKMGILTFDGQHTNERGTSILTGLMAREIARWDGMWDSDYLKKSTKNNDVMKKKKKSHSKIS
jgi:hypothetical protein